MERIMIIAFICFMVIFGPLALIWSLNTLFGLALAFSLKNWAAAVILSYYFGKAQIKVKK